MPKRDVERILRASAHHLSDGHIDDTDDLADHFDDVLETDQPIRRRERRSASHTRGRLTDEARERLRQEVAEEPDPPATAPPPFGDRWSTWYGAEDHGPEPRPDWVQTSDSAVDVERGVLKTGKEADVHLVERSLPDDGKGCLLAVKRYRSAGHRLFHRDAGYLEGRRMKESRQQRAVENRTKFGRNLIAQQWAVAEFGALAMLWSAGLPVPYPVQRIGSELMLEFIGTPDGEAAPRLSDVTGLDVDDLVELWRRLCETLTGLAGMGYTHGDLSAYNILLFDDTPVLIDLPQLVDIVTNPRGPEYLARDVENIAGWFASRGLPPDVLDVEAVTARLLVEAGAPGGSR